jgi:hypothetical protein
MTGFDAPRQAEAKQISITLIAIIQSLLSYFKVSFRDERLVGASG